MPSLPRLTERRRYFRAAVRFAAAARRVLLRRRALGFTRRLKADASFVTDADLAVERALRAAIHHAFPDHGVIGEELPPVAPGADYQWILDPIDGTLSFLHGIPFYGTIIGLHHRGRPVVGVIDHAGLGTCYAAAAGLGAWRDGRRLRIRDIPRFAIDHEVISAGDRSRFVHCGRARAFDQLMRTHPQVRGYMDCIGHTLAAEGAVGAAVDYGLRLWDIAATQVLVEEAGGRYVIAHQSRRDGLPYYGIICGKPTVVGWLERIFA